MADLDDFFAKKDRKKPKGKKFTTTEEIAKKLEEKKVEKPKKEKITYQLPVTGQTADEEIEKPRVEEEEEWKEFEEEKKDYTGLKIQNLTLQEEVEEEIETIDEDALLEENQQGEMVRRRKGPWRNIETDGVDSPQPVAPVEVVPAPAVAPVSMPAKYVSPHLRNQPSAPLRMQRGGKTSAPDIMNNENFPTLSAATNETPVSWGRKKQESGFEEVRNSKSHSNRGDTRENKNVEIGNKFGALQSENS